MENILNLFYQGAEVILAIVVFLMGVVVGLMLIASGLMLIAWVVTVVIGTYWNLTDKIKKNNS